MNEYDWLKKQKDEIQAKQKAKLLEPLQQELAERDAIILQQTEEIARLKLLLAQAEDALEPFSRANYVVTGRWRQCLYCGFGTTEETLRKLTLVDPLVEHNKTCPYRRAAETHAAIRGEK